MNEIRNTIKAQAQKIADFLDRMDGKNNRIDAQTWKNYAVKNWGAKDNVNNFISIFNATKSIEKYLKNNANITGSNPDDIGEKWYNELVSISESDKNPGNESQETNSNRTPVEVADKSEPVDALHVDNSNNIIAANNEKDKNIPQILNLQKDKIITKMHDKWSAKFKNSNLDKNFYNKLYDVIKTLGCEIDDIDYNQSKYSSKEEQTMDEVIAVLAGESKLNSKSSNYIYRGLFQLDAASLQTVKAMGKKHNISGIKQNITLNQFAKLSGAEQLNYLVGHMAYARMRSGLTQDEKITPSQLWAMIKKPKYGQKNSLLTQQKARAINRVFSESKIERGVA